MVHAEPEPEPEPEAPVADLVELPSRHPVADSAEPFDVEDPFGGFDTFDEQAAAEGVALPSLTISGLTDDPFADSSFPGDVEGDAAPWSAPLVEPPVEQPDVRRSMSMLSEKAAQALASVAGGEPATTDDEAAQPEGDDDERARMLRFLGSV
jgi:hypothetical protein